MVTQPSSWILGESQQHSSMMVAITQKGPTDFTSTICLSTTQDQWMHDDPPKQLDFGSDLDMRPQRSSTHDDTFSRP